MKVPRLSQALISVAAIASFPMLWPVTGSRSTSGRTMLAVASTPEISVSDSGISAHARPAASDEASELPLIQPAELANILKANGPKPLILQVGFRVLYLQAHIPGSEYVGPGSSTEGLEQIRARVKALPRTKTIVLYCGCCPWSHCHNVRPAYQALEAMGFKNVKVLFIAHDFGSDWVNAGYPVTTGQ